MNKLFLIVLSILCFSAKAEEGFRVHSEVSGYELGDDDKYCCFYMDHFIYYNGIYVGCYNSQTGTCCPSNGEISGNGLLTETQLNELAHSEAFINANNQAISEFLLEHGGNMGSIDVDLNESTGNIVLRFYAQQNFYADLSILPFTFGNLYQQSNIKIVKGYNTIEIIYNPALQSTRPQNYMIKLIGKEEGFKSIELI